MFGLGSSCEQKMQHQALTHAKLFLQNVITVIYKEIFVNAFRCIYSRANYRNCSIYLIIVCRACILCLIELDLKKKAS